MVCCRQRLSFHRVSWLMCEVTDWLGWWVEHKVGSGSVFVVDANMFFDGDLGRGTCSLFERELFFAWFLLGITW